MKLSRDNKILITHAKWELTRGECVTPGVSPVTVYGVEARSSDGLLWTFPDVSADKSAVERLIALLCETDPEPCHWQDIVEDFIAQEA